MEPRHWRRNRGNRGELDHGDPELPSSTVQALPIRVGPVNLDKEQTYHYWPFSTSDLYNWKTQNLLFQRNPKASLTSKIPFCSLITSPGMIVSSCCRFSSLRKNGSESWQRHRNGSQGRWETNHPASPCGRGVSSVAAYLGF